MSNYAVKSHHIQFSSKAASAKFSMKQECLVFMGSSHDMMAQMTHAEHTHTHTQTLQSLDSPTVSTHHRSSCRDFLRQAKLLGKTWKERERYRGKEGERERQIVVHDKQKRIYLLWLFKRKKQSLLIFCEISTELTLHAVTNLACPFYTSEVRELSEFIVVPGVFLCDSVTLEI